jgi:hypothetical protein
VLFGEALPLHALSTLERELERGFDVVFTIGTTSVFSYIAAPAVLAKRAGALTVEINPGTSEVSEIVDRRIAARAKPAMQAVRRVRRGLMADGARLLVYDRTCAGHLGGLSTAWSAGSRLYRWLDRIDASFGATSWQEGLAWICERSKDRAIAEIQFWGHGKWGCALVASDVLDARALSESSPLHRPLREIRERLAPDALWWFRTCETFGAHRGIEFARRWTDFLGARAAGHTYVIGVWQSGLHGLAPGRAPDWSASEGLAEGTPAEPRRARVSLPTETRTISCFDGKVPSEWFA